MDIFPDWLGETGGAGVPYPVLVQGLELIVAAETIPMTVNEIDVALGVAMDAPLLAIEMGVLDVSVVSDTLDLEVDGG